MKIRWKLYPENIITGNFVALMEKDTGRKPGPYLMYVYLHDGVYHGKFYKDYSYFNDIRISTSYVIDYVKKNYECQNLSVDQILLKRLETACMLIEEEFNNQAKNLVTFFS